MEHYELRSNFESMKDSGIAGALIARALPWCTGLIES